MTVAAALPPGSAAVCHDACFGDTGEYLVRIR